MLAWSPGFGSWSAVCFPWVLADPGSVRVTGYASKKCIHVFFRNFKYLMEAFKWKGVDPSDVSMGEEEQRTENKPHQSQSGWL